MAAVRSQRGAALLLMLVVLVLGTAWWLASAFSRDLNRTAEERAHNARVLSHAKAALIGYVAHTAAQPGENDPGALPCPEANAWVGDPDTEGRAGPNCSLPAVGRLPWRTLGLDQLRDAANEPLWYVVSPGWAKPNSTTNTLINSNSVGQLDVGGSAAVALIIAPGRAVTTSCVPPRNQARALPAPGISALDYIECLTGASYSASDGDQAVAVTDAELLPAIEAAVAWRFEQEMAPQIRTAYSGGLWPAGEVLPFAAPFGDPSTSNFQGAPVLSTGTASVVNGSATVALSASITPSVAGRYLRVAGSPNTYRIAAHAAGSSTLTLGTPYPESTTSATYAIFAADGLLPVTSSCSTSDPRCDASFVTWRNAATFTRTGGAFEATPTTCTAGGTPSVLTCTVRYFYIPLLIPDYMDFRVDAAAENVGRALRQLNPAVPIGDVASYTLSNVALSGDASASIRVSGRTDAASTNILTGTIGAITCGSFGLVCLESTITVPIGLFADHPVVDPSNAASNWFYRNNWHHVAYYAAAPNVTPNGPRSCTTSGTCLGVNFHPDDGKHRGLVLLSGRRLAGQSTPRSTLNDWFEGTNATGASPFTLREPALMINRSFNDRVAVIDKNP